MLVANNKVIVNNQNTVLKPWVFPPIVLENRDIAFPGYSNGGMHNSNTFMFTSSVQNSVYVDFGDGTPVVSHDFIGDLNFRTVPTLVRNYGTRVTRFVKIWFKIPSKITAVVMGLVTFHGEFPIAFSYFNLTTLNIGSYSYFNNFNDEFPTSYLNTLKLTHMLNTAVIGVPEWILKSRIVNLTLGLGFNLGNPSTNKVDRMIGIKDLTHVGFGSESQIIDVSSNYKDINTLYTLYFAGPTMVQSITTNINACKQIKVLAFGPTSNGDFIGTTVLADGTFGGTYFNSWGIGVGGMSLSRLVANTCIAVPTTLPTGLKDCLTLKDIRLRSSYHTQVRIDEFVNNAYQEVISNASMSLGDTAFRNIYLDLGPAGANAAYYWRPSGTYQMPINYIQGVDNGIPASPMEKLYVLVKQYKWRIDVALANGNGSRQTLS